MKDLAGNRLDQDPGIVGSRKLGVSDRTQAAVRAIELGLVCLEIKH